MSTHKFGGVGGVGQNYIAITGTTGSPAIHQDLLRTISGSISATHVFTLSDLTGGVGLNSSLINGVYIECEINILGSGATGIISALYPDGSSITIQERTHLSTGTGANKIIAFLPVNIGQTEISISLSSATAVNCHILIIGVSQIF